MKCSYRTPDAAIEHSTEVHGTPPKIRTVPQSRSIQSLVASRSEECEEETELVGLKDITADEFDQFQLKHPILETRTLFPGPQTRYTILMTFA